MSLKSFVPALVVSVLFGLSFSTVRAQEYKSENLFYLVNSPQSFSSFKEHADQISIVCPVGYHMDKYGVLAGFIDPRVLAIAKEKGIEVMPLFSVDGQESIHDLVTNQTSRAEAIRLMLFYGQQFGYYGWQFDVEGIHIPDKDSYTSFYEQAADSLHSHGFKISMAIVKSVQPAPETGNASFQRFLYEDWRGAYDIPAIARASDFISVMTYDQHTSLTPPGPVAGLPWVERIVKYLLDSGIAPDKISLGVPTYSDYWYPVWNEQSGARSTRSEISYQEVQSLLAQFNAKERWMKSQQVNYAYWEEGGIFNWLFIEDAKSFGTKVELLKKYHLRGISVWLLGLEDPATWGVLRKEVRTEKIR